MPILDITASDIGADRSRMKLAYIEGVMLWPDDAPARARALDASAARNYVEETLRLEASGTSRTFAPGGFATVAEFLSTSQPIRGVHEEAKIPFLRGLIAGEILSNTLGWEALEPGHGSVASAIKEVAVLVQKIWPEKPTKDDRAWWSERPSEKTIINTIWPRYKPVSHLWAASFTVARPGAGKFPCRVDQIAIFLSVAETYRRQAERFVPQRRAQPLLDGATSWRVPAGIALPLVHIETTPRKK